MRTAINPLGVGDMAKDYIIDYGSNSNGWYRKWKSGFIEQWGAITNLSTNTIQNLPISFSNDNYICVLERYKDSGDTTQNALLLREKQTSYIRVNCISSNNINIQWYACGY